MLILGLDLNIGVYLSILAMFYHSNKVLVLIHPLVPVHTNAMVCHIIYFFVSAPRCVQCLYDNNYQ